MIIHVANPIYDSVFKYIMEDERIAKTMLSALLKKEVVHVTVRPHEYSNTTRDTLSMFRIDFAATVREREGDAIKDRIVLIELQKTWLNTESCVSDNILVRSIATRTTYASLIKKALPTPWLLYICSATRWATSRNR